MVLWVFLVSFPLHFHAPCYVYFHLPVALSGDLSFFPRSLRNVEFSELNFLQARNPP